MIVQTLEVGMLHTNCYLVVSEAAHEAVVIDPGGDPDAILAAIAELGAAVRHILLTHFHFDHILAAPELVRDTGAPLAIHEAEGGLLANPPALFSLARPDAPSLEADRLLGDGDEVTIGDAVLRVLHTPGHSPGGVSFYSAAAGVVFCGDALFAGGVGRTDLPGSNAAQLVDSIRRRLLALPDDTTVYPGHGPATTIGHERRANPWVGEGRLRGHRGTA